MILIAGIIFFLNKIIVTFAILEVGANLGNCRNLIL